MIRRLIPLGVGMAALASLVIGVNPAKLLAALGRYDLRLVPALAALSLLYYVLQGVRWHALLGAEGVHLSARETILLNIAGQSTSMLPLGELSRAVFVAEVADASFGVVTACVTVQELTYSAFLLAIAVPASLEQPVAAAAVIAALLGTAAVFAILTVHRIFRRVVAMCGRIKGVRTFLPAIEELQIATVDLLRHRRTYTTSWISLLQACTAVTLFWCAAEGLQHGAVSWLQCALVYAVINVASAISLSPGGLGAFELGGAGLLVAVGVPFDVAAATTIVHRAADKGMGTMAGFGAYWYARRRWGLGRITLARLGHGPHAPNAGADAPPARASC